MKVKINDLRPTQFYLGMAEVEDKTKKYKQLSLEQLDELYQIKQVPVIIGPDNRFYMIDRHHNARTALNLGMWEVYVRVVKDLSKSKDFWGEMIKNGWCFLEDHQGNIQDPQNLPIHILRLKDDPYRSLVYFLREEGILNKDEKMPFVEFRWAKIIKENVQIEENERESKDLSTSIKKAKEFLKNTLLLIEGLKKENIK